MARVAPAARLRDLMCTESRLRYLAWRAAPRSRTLVVALKDGVRLMLRPPPAGDLSVAHEIFVQQCYRAPCPLDSPALRTIVDVGSNCGFSLLYFAARFPQAELVAFEPHPAHQRQIEHHLRLNALGARVSLIRAAAGCAAGPAFLRDQSDRSHVVDQPALDTHPIHIVDFFDAIGARFVNLLKLDCEGAEYDLLMDARFAALNIGALVMECHPQAAHPHAPAELHARLQQLRFQVVPETVTEPGDCAILWAFAAPVPAP